MRTAGLAILLVSSRAHAEVHWFGMTTTEALVPGVGLGVQLAQDGNAITVDSSIVGLPICLGGCEMLYGYGVSLAVQRQVTERVFVGLRGGTRHWNPEHGWTNSGYLELGGRRDTGTWLVSAAIDAGVSVWPDHSLSPAVAFRLTVGR